MASPYIQLEGNIQFADINFSDQVTSLVITRTRNTVNVPATFANAQEDPKAGSRSQELTINFFANPFSVSSFWKLLWDQIDTDTGELDFQATFDDGVISATNPVFTGTVIVTGVDTGGTVGDLRAQSQTYPIKAGTLVKSNSGS